MENPSRDVYLVTAVMTATPQKLHLMLIEGAIRCVHTARRHWAANEDEHAGEALIRAQEILAQMLAGVNRDANPDLAKQVASVYMFIYRRIMEASLLRDDAKLDEALKILEIEQGTWRQLCDQLSAAPSGGQPAPGRMPPVPPGIFASQPADAPPARWSLEA